MIVDLIDEVAAWQRDGTTGLNAVLPLMPGGSVTPPTITIVDENTAPWVARAVRLPREKVEGGPLLAIRQMEEAPVPVTIEDHQREGLLLPLALQYAAIGDSTDDELAFGRQVLRTALRVIAKKYLASIPGEFIRNTVAIGAPKSATWLPPLAEPDDTVVSLVVSVPFPVFDPWALGA